MNFYPPPEVITAGIYYNIPSSLRRQESTEWAQGFPHKLEGVFLEGPVVNQQGDVFVVDIPFGRILKIDSDKKVETCAEWDADNSVVPYLTRRNLERFKGVNDLIVDSKGNIYFTDQGRTGMTDPTGKVYRYTTDKKLDCLVDNGPSPNGLVLSVDEKTLYVAMTRANQVWQLPLHEDGTTTKVGVFFQGFGSVGPDGLTIDQQGNLFVCVPGLGRVFVVDRYGIPLKSIQSPLPNAFITNCTFGGQGNQELFMTDSVNGAILKVDWHCPGAQSFIPKSR
ncbi:hypothetical protein N7510_007640 [Penicillium lagena]|uniref:uncharacterized protein n=1 Tax=Penicillium lagena TaxID=94218 RepID=UPI00253FC3DF|nr:uncharacterized protein N7510_007640 [Penicillium lagena]KAJ5610921.1 hypothetical protein N7510_007640 [Penicillium lagena]